MITFEFHWNIEEGITLDEFISRNKSEIDKMIALKRRPFIIFPQNITDDIRRFCVRDDDDLSRLAQGEEIGEEIK